VYRRFPDSRAVLVTYVAVRVAGGTQPTVDLLPRTNDMRPGTIDVTPRTGRISPRTIVFRPAQTALCRRKYRLRQCQTSSPRVDCAFGRVTWFRRRAQAGFCARGGSLCTAQSDLGAVTMSLARVATKVVHGQETFGRGAMSFVRGRESLVHGERNVLRAGKSFPRRLTNVWARQTLTVRAEVRFGRVMDCSRRVEERLGRAAACAVRIEGRVLRLGSLAARTRGRDRHALTGRTSRDDARLRARGTWTRKADTAPLVRSRQASRQPINPRRRPRARPRCRPPTPRLCTQIQKSTVHFPTSRG
jgi:hypothetical protein